MLAESLGATVVQRHPAGPVRLVGSFGVYRWDGLGWHHEPLVSTWLDSLGACVTFGDRDVLETLLALDAVTKKNGFLENNFGV